MLIMVYRLESLDNIAKDAALNIDTRTPGALITNTSGHIGALGNGCRVGRLSLMRLTSEDVCTGLPSRVDS